jgi:FMN phosphatase YigB (HAD superfamily)
MSKKNVKAILFDLGNVIVGVDAVKLEKAYASYGKVKEGAVVDYFMESDNMNRYMEGKLTSSQFYNKTRREFKMDIKFSEFYQIWNSIFYPFPEMNDIIGVLKEKYPDIKLVLISNTNESHYEFIKQEYKILDLLDGHVVSHEMGCQKPNAKIFTEAMRVAGSIPRETIYTDDRMDLIEAARVMGICAFQFTTPEQFRKDLVKRDIHI